MTRYTVRIINDKSHWLSECRFSFMSLAIYAAFTLGFRAEEFEVKLV